MSPKKITEIQSILSSHVLSPLNGFIKEAILPNRLCGHGQRWLHWIHKVALLLMWNSFSWVIPAETNNLAKTTQECLWCSWSYV